MAAIGAASSISAIAAILGWSVPAMAQDAPPSSETVELPTIAMPEPPSAPVTAPSPIEAPYVGAPARPPAFAVAPAPVAYAPSAPGPSYAPHNFDRFFPLTVLAHDGAAQLEFYLLPQGVCDGQPDAGVRGCLGFILAKTSLYGYGPSAAGSQRMLRSGANYYLVPKCTAPPRWEHRIIVSLAEAPKEVRLKCP